MKRRKTKAPYNRELPFPLMSCVAGPGVEPGLEDYANLYSLITQSVGLYHQPNITSGAQRAVSTGSRFWRDFPRILSRRKVGMSTDIARLFNKNYFLRGPYY